MALISTREMALISEWMEQRGKKAKTKRKKVLDNAGIVRDAIFCSVANRFEHASRPTYAEDSYFFDAIIAQPPIVE